ncbi:acyl-CoA thioesterase [Zhongshania aliphaticivorans]|uniref:acyl-CoA thioesterase n=1 Tax=Zhongshania aliphaticivorans TaxID=1470434 RepID=UPI0012E43198|nr:thioesterase family protein [Zhongshania aliphaticivorans]CAA0106918.1 Uncharacterised protein [Zhongshania aliphaticivorans]
MARVHIPLPDQFMFSTDIALHVSHMNWGGHLDSAQLLVVVSEARERFFVSLGYSQTNIEGFSLVMADAAQRYLSEAFYGDVMIVEIGITEWFDKGFDLSWRMINGSNDSVVALGKSAMLFMDMTVGKPQSTPLAFRERLSLHALL